MHEALRQCHSAWWLEKKGGFFSARAKGVLHSACVPGLWRGGFLNAGIDKMKSPVGVFFKGKLNLFFDPAVHREQTFALPTVRFFFSWGGGGVPRLWSRWARTCVPGARFGRAAPESCGGAPTPAGRRRRAGSGAVSLVSKSTKPAQ